MHTPHHAPPRALRGPQTLADKMMALGCADAFMQLRALRKQIDATIEQMIGIVDAIDGDVDLEDDGEAGRPCKIADGLRDLYVPDDVEPALGAPEAVTCNDGPATAVRKRRRKTCQLACLGDHSANLRNGPTSPSLNCGKVRVDRSCDQSDWSRDGGGYREGGDLEADTADDEPSLGAPERAPVETVCVNGVWGYRQTDQAEWPAGGSDDREGDLADTADDREGDPLDAGEQDDADLEEDARRAPRVPPSIGFDGLCGSRLIVGRVIDGGSVKAIAHVGAPEAVQ